MNQETSAPKRGAKAKAPPRERLLKAADALFERHGIRGVGVEAIATAADTNKMTLYRHFSSKDELVAEWLRMLVEDWATMWDMLEQLPDTSDHHARIDAFIEAYGNAFERISLRGCPILNSLAELKEKDHPARRVLDEYKAKTRKRMIKYFRKFGVSEPTQAAEEIQLLLDGAKTNVQDLGAARSRARFVQLAKTLLEARMADG